MKATGQTMTMNKEERPSIRGKFLFIGDEKFYMRGVTYGTFRPNLQEGGLPFPSRATVDEDFRQMRAGNINCVRLYTVPPLWLLDCAWRHGLRVMVGIPWEQHLTFLDDKERVRAIEARVREAVRGLNRHPAVLMYAVGNEIPPAIVRWYGRARIERFLKRLYKTVKREDPQGLVTYVNFPTTEYLQLKFLDVLCFNVYLEQKETFEAYLARLQNIADEKPIVMAEVGLDSRRNGEQAQADSLRWQIRSTFAGGYAGVFIFAWTDEWYRGGVDIDDWDFGLTTRGREPKPALVAVSDSFRFTPFNGAITWPRVSVIVCSYNGARTIRKTLSALERLDYPDYEIVVVDDGSRDDTAEIAGEYRARLIRTENRGLSAARNEALNDEAAEIVAYIDDDAYPDPHWLKFIANTFLTTDYVALGGPNILPPESGFVSNCVGNAPGGPVHVLVGNTEAEHIPGCNMAYRKKALKAIGGFDPSFRVAGDDVDVCWRLQRMGWKIGFHPSALVYHNRRDSIRKYLKQQYNYGKAEAMLEDKWPQKYNAVGHIPWNGRIYGRGQTLPFLIGRWRVYHGRYGGALFQSIYQPAGGMWSALPLMPEYFLLVVFLGILTTAGLSWTPLLAAAPLFVAAVAVSFIQAFLSASSAQYTFKNISALKKMRLWIVTAALHFLQPLARLLGRMKLGLSPWRVYGVRKFLIPRPRTFSYWSEVWRPAGQWLDMVTVELNEQNLPIIPGGPFDRWDLQVRGGFLGATYLLMTIEEHGGGKQLLRFRLMPNFKFRRSWVIPVFGALAVLAALDNEWGATLFLGGIAVLFFWRMLQKCAYSKVAIVKALEGLELKEC